MPERFPCSPYDSVMGLVYFARMLDKIRLHAAGELPPAYHEYLGGGFDERCVHFLGVHYAELREHVVGGEKDEPILEWCYENGRGRTDEEVEVWSGFMMKRGWRDETSERVASRLKEAGLEHLDGEAVTMFDFIDFDEGRTPPDFRKWEPPRFKS